jgi:hypothetical protein
LGLTALPNAAAEASGGLYTRGTGAGQINQDANGRIDVNVAAISTDSSAADNLESYTDGTTPAPVNAIQISGDATAADNAESFFDGTGYAGTNNVIPTVTTLTNAPSDSSGVTTLLSRLSATRAGYLDNLSAGAVALEASVQSVLSKLLKYVQLIVRKDAAIATDNSTELTAINADGGSGAGAFANTTDALEALRDRGDSAWTTVTAANIRSAVGLASANLDSQLDALPTANENADAFLDRSNAIETGLTPRQAMRLSAAADGGKLSGAATTTVVIRNAVADSKDRITATVDADGNRTAITYDVS